LRSGFRRCCPAIQRFKKVQRILLIVLFLNLAVAFAKIIYGTLTSTLSMTADGYHSLFDGVSNIVGLVGSFIAARPPDKEHPYGHQKYETIASIFIALLLLYVGVEIFRHALDRFLIRSVPEVTAISFLVIIGTMCINYLVTRYEYRQGLALRSQVLIADSLHTKSDIYVSLSVILSLAAVKLGFPLLDPLIAVLISFLIFRAGFRIMKESSKVLLDMSRLEEDEICNLVLGVEGVLGCHKIRTRGGMGDIRIDMHVLVQADLTLEEAHLISHRVSKMLKAEYNDVTDVVVHLEPALPQGSYSKKTT
jgi:cation diffusion facilitator family transporter